MTTGQALLAGELAFDCMGLFLLMPMTAPGQCQVIQMAIVDPEETFGVAKEGVRRTSRFHNE